MVRGAVVGSVCMVAPKTRPGAVKEGSGMRSIPTTSFEVGGGPSTSSGNRIRLPWKTAPPSSNRQITKRSAANGVIESTLKKIKLEKSGVSSDYNRNQLQGINGRIIEENPNEARFMRETSSTPTIRGGKDESSASTPTDAISAPPRVDAGGPTAAAAAASPVDNLPQTEPGLLPRDTASTHASAATPKVPSVPRDTSVAASAATVPQDAAGLAASSSSTVAPSSPVQQIIVKSILKSNGNTAPRPKMKDQTVREVEDLRNSIMQEGNEPVITRKKLIESLANGKFENRSLDAISRMSLSDIKTLIKGIDSRKLSILIDNHPAPETDKEQRALSRFGEAVMSRRVDAMEKEREKGFDCLDALTSDHLKAACEQGERPFLTVDQCLSLDIYWLALKCYNRLGKSNKRTFIREFLKYALVHMVMPSQRAGIYVSNNHKNMMGGYKLTDTVISTLRDTSRMMFNCHKLRDETMQPGREMKRLNHDVAFRAVLSKAAHTVRKNQVTKIDWLTDCVLGPDGEFVQDFPKEGTYEMEDENNRGAEFDDRNGREVVEEEEAEE